jgi:hypothetical protein
MSAKVPKQQAETIHIFGLLLVFAGAGGALWGHFGDVPLLLWVGLPVGLVGAGLVLWALAAKRPVPETSGKTLQQERDRKIHL